MIKHLFLLILIKNYYVSFTSSLSNIFIFSSTYVDEEHVRSLLKESNVTPSGSIQFYYEDKMGIFNNIYLCSENVSSLFLLIHLSPAFERLLITLINNRSLIISYSKNQNTNLPQVRTPIFHLNTGNKFYVKSLFILLKANNFKIENGIIILMESDLRSSLELERIFQNMYAEYYNVNNTLKKLNILWIQPTWSEFEIAVKMSVISHFSSRLLFIHSTNYLVRKIFKVNNEYSLINNEMVIILSDLTLPNKADILNHSINFLNILYIERWHFTNAVDVMKEYFDIIKRIIGSYMKHCNSNQKDKCKRRLYKNLSNEFSLEGEYQFNKISLYKLYKQGSIKHWSECNQLHGEKIIEKGLLCQNYYFPNNYIFKKVLVAIVPTEPFIKIDVTSEAFINIESDTPDCGHNVVCYELPEEGGENFDIYNHINQLRKNIKLTRSKKFIRCCYGFSITILQKLAMDLKYDLTYYIVRNHSYGNIINNEWNGMVKNIIDGVAHIGAGAFSITMEREKVIDMSDPFYTSDIEILSTMKDRESLLGAVYKPFTLELWLFICIIATVCAVAMGIFEWNSPFGLSPWGRQRHKNYTLASALNAVYAVMFGHTIKTKAPKSWPVKWVQNCWAYACIVIVAMYTANLTVFIAGVAHVSNSFSELKVGNREIGITKDSNIIQTLIDLNDKRYPVAKWNVRYLDSSEDAEELFLNNTLDIILDESLVIRKLKAKRALCSIKTRKINIGSIGYGFGFSKGSLLKNAIKNRLRIYSDFGFFDLLEKSISDSNFNCQKSKLLTDNDKTGRKGYKIENMAGLFLALSVGLVIAFVILFSEHMLYWWIIPRWHKMPKESYWKSIHVMFISQRLYRIIHSERLIRPKETTKEMLDMVKNREFGKAFFKENIQKPIVSRKASPTKMSVFDISSEMVKLKRQSQSQEHIDPGEEVQNYFQKRSKSFDDYHIKHQKSPQRILSFDQNDKTKLFYESEASTSTLFGSDNNSLRIAFTNPLNESIVDDFKRYVRK